MPYLLGKRAWDSSGLLRLLNIWALVYDVYLQIGVKTFGPDFEMESYLGTRYLFMAVLPDYYIYSSESCLEFPSLLALESYM